MKRIIEFLSKTQFGALATIENGQARVRPFQFQFEDKGKLYFCTSSDKQLINQLLKNPFIEYTSFDKALNYIRISGKISITCDTRLKERVFAINPFYKEKFNTPENEDMILFFLEKGTALFGTFDTYPPESIEFNHKN